MPSLKTFSSVYSEITCKIYEIYIKIIFFKADFLIQNTCTRKVHLHLYNTKIKSIHTANLVSMYSYMCLISMCNLPQVLETINHLNIVKYQTPIFLGRNNKIALHQIPTN